LTSGRRPFVKIIAESLSQHDEKHVVPTPLSVGKGRKKKKNGGKKLDDGDRIWCVNYHRNSSKAITDHIFTDSVRT
jgi:hypothetical protein